MSPVEIMIWQSYIIQGLNVNRLRWNRNICMFYKITSKISIECNSGNANIICRNLIWLLIRFLNILFYNTTT